MKKELHFFGAAALITFSVTACTPTQDLNGTWRLHSANNTPTRLLRFIGDSVFYLNPHQLESIGGPVQFSTDSMVLFNPWDAELHYQMKRVSDTVFLEDGLWLTKLGSAIAKDVGGRFGVELPFSEEEKTVVRDRHALAVFLTPCKVESFCSDTFFYGYGLAARDQWANPAEWNALFSNASTELLEDGRRTVLIYSDTAVPDSIVHMLTSRFQSATDGRARVYRGYFCPRSEYYLTFETLNEVKSSSE